MTTSHFHPYFDSFVKGTTSILDLYVRAVDGDDNNIGSIASPLATITEAVQRVPLVIDFTVRIHIGPDGGTPYDFPVLLNRVLNANIYFLGDGAGSGDGFTELLASTAALVGSGENVVKNAGLVVDVYQGKTIEILTGAAAGDRRTIRDNTATDIIPCASFTAAVALDDTYRILEPAITLDVPTFTGDEWTQPMVTNVGQGHVQTSGVTLSKDTKKVWFVNLMLGTGFTLSLLNSNCAFSGVELLNPLGSISLPGSLLLCGYEANNSAGYKWSVNSPVADLGVATDTSWLGWGMLVNTNAAVGLGDLVGFFVVVGSLSLNSKARVWMEGGHITDGISNLVAFEGSSSWFYAHAASHPITQIGGNPCVRITNGYVALIYVNLYGAGNGVEVEEFGKVLSVGITGNVGGIGVVTSLGGQFESDSNLRIDGTVGDFSEDGGLTLRAKATLAVNTTFIEAASNARIFRASN